MHRNLIHHGCSSPAWWFLRGAPTRSHSELGRENPQRQWYFVSRRGRVGRCQACQEHPFLDPSLTTSPRRHIAKHVETTIRPEGPCRRGVRSSRAPLPIETPSAASTAGTRTNGKASRTPRHPRDRPTPHAGWSSPVARQAHNLKVVSSNLAPATNTKTPPGHPRRGFAFERRPRGRRDGRGERKGEGRTRPGRPARGN